MLPFLASSAFVFVYRALQAPQEYIGFVVLGGAMTAFWLNVIWMMASQLYWEKSQGNLELYFAAPIDIMAILFGMALGGMVMSATRAVVVLVIASIVFGVTFEVEQWFLLGAVFLLTLTALYGLGMMLASLFLVWGREAFQLTQLFTEPVYFVSGLNFPVGRLGLLGCARDRHDPAGGGPGRDAPAGVLGWRTCRRHAIAGDRGADPRGDDRRLPLGGALDAPGDRADGPARRPPVDPMAVEAGTPDPAAGLGSPGLGRIRHASDAGLGLRDQWRTFSTAANLGWQMEANWTDPVLFFIYSVAKPVSAALILVVMLDIISGGAQPEYRAFVVVGTALWSFVLAGMAGLAWSVLDDRERYRMLKYVYVSPSDFLVVLLGRGVARIAVGAMGALITHRDRRAVCSVCRSTSRPSTGSCSRS